jgi:hypothetical protein
VGVRTLAVGSLSRAGLSGKTWILSGELSKERLRFDPAVPEKLVHLASELRDDLWLTRRFFVDNRSLLKATVSDELANERQPRRAPKSVALLVSRGLGHLARVKPVEERLLANLELSSHLEGGEILHS